MSQLFSGKDIILNINHLSWTKYRAPTMQNRFERFDITPYQEIIFYVFVFNSIHDSTTCRIYPPLVIIL